MESTPKPVKFYHRLPVRIVAVVLAVVMLVSVGVATLSSVSLRQVEVVEDLGAATNYLAGHNDYINQNLLRRAGGMLNNMVGAPTTLQEHYEYAEALIAKENYKDALPHIDACIRLCDEDDTELLAALWMKNGCLQALLGEYEQAIEGIDKSVALTGPSSDSALVKAQIYLTLDESEKALDSLGEYLSVNPSDMQAQASMAELYSAMGHYPEAVECYTALIDTKDPTYYNDSVYLGRAGCLLLLGEVDNAKEDIAVYTGIIGGPDAASEFLYGMCDVQLGEYDVALESFDKALDMGHESPALCYEQMAQCYFLTNDFEKAIETGEKALEAKGDVSQPGMLYRQMGVSAMALAQNEQAIEYFTQAIRHGGETGEDHYYRGVCYMGKGEYELAIEDFSFAVDVGAMQQDCYYYRGICYLETQKEDEAVADFRKAAVTGEDEDIAQMAREMLEALGAALEE